MFCLACLVIFVQIHIMIFYFIHLKVSGTPDVYSCFCIFYSEVLLMCILLFKTSAMVHQEPA